MVLLSYLAAFFSAFGAIFFVYCAFNIARWIYDVFLASSSDAYLAAFKGDWALITGAAGGIGRCFAEQLAARGLHLILADINEAGLEELRGLLAGRFPAVSIKTMRLDLMGEAAAIEANLKIFMQDHGINKIGVLLCCAGGVGRYAVVNERPTSAVYRDVQYNVSSTLLCCSFVIPYMKHNGRGLIMLMSSMSALSGMPGSPEYSGGKAFLRLWSFSVEEELKIDNILITAFTPGFITTPLTQYARGLLVAEPESFVRWALHKCHRGPVCNPHPGHALQEALGVNILGIRSMRKAAEIAACKMAKRMMASKKEDGSPSLLVERQEAKDHIEKMASKRTALFDTAARPELSVGRVGG
ncbi:unnamed protein product [Vitrella brassicaformis CCMP3155]|uniref:Uncharacterized protein n=1 Tax=Vitrella brassicaformis (strain CCMP3155) TaxID=1169540 RepID=A0A0G4EJF5_VITBC|nr:unnamed protein product [Vitrella brassicaformis CCMP3155]|eukprot:CEL96879.1 unnamed protein product [Vitrella brassicaformis CCMP3155]